MSEPIIEQRGDEDIWKALDRAHVAAIENGKMAILATTDGIKVRIFADDAPEDAKGRWRGELERAGLLFVLTPEDMGPKVMEAIDVAENGALGHSYVRETEYGIMVPVVAGDTVESVVERLNDEFGKLVAAGEIERKEIGLEGVPLEDGLVNDWAELHPAMKAVVIAGLRTLMESTAFKAAQNQAHQIGMMAALDAMRSGMPGPVANALGSSMMEGMVAGMGSNTQVEVAQRNAFKLAIRHLGG